MEFIFSLDRIRLIAGQFWDAIGDHRVFAFHGQMGAGKTTFIHALCDVKAVSSVVGSPTFSLVNEYSFQSGSAQNDIFHIDLYRIKDEEEAIQAGIEDCIYSGSYCFVEWPEKAPGLFPPDTVHVYISVTDDGMRSLKLQFPEGNL